jgi:spore coat polysaccharide biosynthesis predicted glycosyltransferase SpsG
MYADCVLNHAIGLNKINYHGENYTKYFLGSEFALLRQGFLKNAKLKTIENINFKKAFVSFGGTNSSKLTLNAVKALMNFKNFSKIYVVIGKAITDKSTLNYFVSNEKIELLIDIGEEVLIQIMKDSDLFIVPSSTIAYELASLRKIIVSGYTTHNQKFLYKGLTHSNIIFEMGDISNFEVKDFKHYIKSILQTPVEILNSKIRSQILHFDGNQEHRLTEIVNSLAKL